MMVMIKKDISRIEIGDIVWCKRYINGIPISKIKDGHDEGPFVIYKIKDNVIYGLYCTSNELTYRKHNKLKLSNYLDKATYVVFEDTYIINNDNYVHFIKKCSKSDFDIVLRYLYLNGLDNDIVIDSNNVGDIISYKKDLYYIYNKRNNYLYGIRVYLYKNNYHFYVGSSKYVINFNCKIKINSNRFYKLVNVVDSFTKERIKDIFKDLRTPGVGKIVTYKWKKYYIYDVIDKYYKCIELSEKYNCLIKFSFKKYYTNYKTILLSKNNNYNVRNISLFMESEHKNNSVKKLINSVSNSSIVKLKNSYFYVYGEYKDKYLVYKLSVSDKTLKYSFQVNKVKYYTDFKDYKISKYSEFEVIYILTREGKERIKELIDTSKKDNSLKKVNNPFISYYKKFKPKCVVINNNTLDKYVIVERDDEYITMVNLQYNKDICKFYIYRSVLGTYSIIYRLDSYSFNNILKVYKGE